MDPVLPSEILSLQMILPGGIRTSCKYGSWRNFPQFKNQGDKRTEYGQALCCGPALQPRRLRAPVAVPHGPPVEAVNDHQHDPDDGGDTPGYHAGKRDHALLLLGFAPDQEGQARGYHPGWQRGPRPFPTRTVPVLRTPPQARLAHRPNEEVL